MKILKTTLKKLKTLHSILKNYLWKYENVCTWSLIKEVIRKKKVFTNLLIVDNKETGDTSVIAEKFNNFLLELKQTCLLKLVEGINTTYSM